MMLRVFFLVLVLQVGIAVMAVAQLGAGEAALRPGDQVRITVWGMPEMSGDFDVAPDGTLEHPLYREVEVTGVPLSVAEERVGSFLRGRDAMTRFVMRPLVRIAVGGEVAQPSLYYHPVNMTIAQAITLAGGVSPEGNLERVRLIRGGDLTFLDLTDPLSEAVEMPIRSGDEIMVSRRGSVMRDYIMPASSVIGAVSGVLILLLRAGVL